MSSYPLVGICGKAGIGKDTVAGMLAEKDGVCIAQADPLKRFGFRVFAFTMEQLWGPSEARNALDRRPEAAYSMFEFWTEVEQNCRMYLPIWLKDIGLPESGHSLLKWLADEFEYAKKNGLTPRHMLQTLGTEFGRREKDSVWVDYARHTARRLLNENMTYDRVQGPVEREAGRTDFVVITDVRFRNEVLAIKKVGGLVIKIIGPGAISLDGAAGTHKSETEQDGIPQSWFDAVIYNDKKQGLLVLKDTVELFSGRQLLAPPQTYTRFQPAAL